MGKKLIFNFEDEKIRKQFKKLYKINIAELEKKHYIDPEELNCLIEGYIYRNSNECADKKDGEKGLIKKHIKERIHFLEKVLPLWKGKTVKLFKETHIVDITQQDKIWKTNTIPISYRILDIFNHDFITKLINKHKKTLKEITYRINPLPCFIFNIACLFLNTEFTTKFPQHYDDVNWNDVHDYLKFINFYCDSFEYEDIKVIYGDGKEESYCDLLEHKNIKFIHSDDKEVSSNRLKSIYNVTKKEVIKIYGKNWTNFLDPVINRHLKNKKEFNEAINKAYKIIKNLPPKAFK